MTFNYAVIANIAVSCCCLFCTVVVAVVHFVVCDDVLTSLLPRLPCSKVSEVLKLKYSA